MASPPFNISEAVPGDSDVVSQFPATERTFRDVVEDWILTEHDAMGRHKIPNISEAARDALTSVGRGTLVYNTDTDTLQICTDPDPVEWEEIFQNVLEAPPDTRLVFQQTTAPTGWTKDTTHNNKAMRLVSGTVSSGGSTAFTSVFAARTIARANLPNITLDVSGSTSEDGDHSHSYDAPHSDAGATAGGVSFNRNNAGHTTSTDGDHTHDLDGVTESLNGGVSQTTMDFAVQYVDFIVANKD